MSWHKVVSMTWASLTIILSTDSMNVKKIMLLVSLPPMLVIIHFFPPRENRIHSLFLIGIRISIWKSESMMASMWLSHMPLINRSPHVSGMLLPWCTPPFWSYADLVDKIFCVPSEERSLGWQCGRYYYVSRCEVRWQDLHCCRLARDAQKRSTSNWHIFFEGWGG